MTIQPLTAILVGIFLISLVTVESGGWFLTRVVRGAVPANALQTSFFRAGHAHAAVLLVLSTAVLLALDGVSLPLGLDSVARILVPAAAILMPAGFFLSVLGKDPARPGRPIALLWIGAGALAIGLLIAGIGLIATAASALGGA